MNALLKSLAACVAVLVLSALPAAAAKRIALVIGNSSYSHVIDLKNPANDADLMEKTLKDVGFDVIRYRDLDQRGMKQAMVEFGRKLKEGAEASMFYYAGHGVELDGVNYLVPVDADTRSKEEADIQNVSVNSFLNLVDNSSVPLNIVILDACRNNPFRSIRSSGQGGLAPVKAPRGTYVAYATAPGAVAEDGTTVNSPFTLALAESMREPGLTLEAVLKRTRLKVQEVTNGAQLPFDSSAITGEFYFVPAVATEPQALVAPANDPAQAAYLAAGDDAGLLRVVAETFGTSIWGALAREKLKNMGKPLATETLPVEPPAEVTITTPEVPAIAPEDEPVVETPAAKPAVKSAVKPAARPAVKRAVTKLPVAKPRVAKPVKQKSAVAVVRKPKAIVVAPKPSAANYPRCDSASFLPRGSLCSRGASVCRVAVVSFGKVGGGGRIVRSCR